MLLKRGKPITLLQWIKAKIKGTLPRRIRLNKALRIIVTRFRPNDISITLEMIMEIGDWAPVANISINGTLGTVTTQTHFYIPQNVIRTQMTDHPGTKTEYN